MSRHWTHAPWDGRVIVQLSTPIADIIKNIESNLTVLEEYREKLNSNRETIAKMRVILKAGIPVIDIKTVTLPKPRTVCTGAQCRTTYRVGTLMKYHYSKACHDPCHLKNIPEQVLNNVDLISCWAMSGQENCHVCGCSYRHHMHIYYDTEEYERRETDENLKSAIQTKESLSQSIQTKISEVDERRGVLVEEKRVITKMTAKFAHFLKNYAIAPYNDAFEGYLEHLIECQHWLG